MTPMIDVVFLLLIFFVLTFRITMPEGDFSVRMSPQGQVHAAAIDTDSVQVRLLADAGGVLSAIQLNGEGIENFALLRQHVAAISASKPDLGIKLFPDEHLRYDYVIQAMTAMHGISNRIEFIRQK